MLQRQRACTMHCGVRKTMCLISEGIPRQGADFQLPLGRASRVGWGWGQGGACTEDSCAELLTR